MLWTVFYISGADGSVIWRLNGKANEFTFINFPINPTTNSTVAFSSQHHPRIHAQNSTYMTISLFDNASNGQQTTAPSSSGKLMSLDLQAKICTLLQEYVLPNGGVLTTSQGSMQPLPNGNVFMGWGSNPYISEHAADGTTLMVGQFGAATGTAAMSYRAFKIGLDDWHGAPQSTPALWAFANTTAGPTAFYVSWNGATDIASWSFFSSSANSSELYPTGGAALGTATRTGFETAFVAEGFVAGGYVQALAVNGSVLGMSPVKRTYVPARNVTAN